MAKDTNFKFGVRAPKERPDMIPENFFEKGAWSGSRDPINFWALNANSSKTRSLATAEKQRVSCPHGGG